MCVYQSINLSIRLSVKNPTLPPQGSSSSSRSLAQLYQNKFRCSDSRNFASVSLFIEYADCHFGSGAIDPIAILDYFIPFHFIFSALLCFASSLSPPAQFSRGNCLYS